MKKYPYWYIKFVCKGNANAVEYLSPDNLDGDDRVDAVEFCSREDAKQALAESGYNPSWAPKIVKVIGKKEKAKPIDIPIAGSLWRNCDDGLTFFIHGVTSLCKKIEITTVTSDSSDFMLFQVYSPDEWDEEVKLNGLECVFSPEE